MTKINHGGPAFPVLGNIAYNSDWVSEDGMTLRDWFAGQADVPWNAVIDTLEMRGETNLTVGRIVEYRAQLKYAEADAMLAEREKGGA